MNADLEPDTAQTLGSLENVKVATDPVVLLANPHALVDTGTHLWALTAGRRPVDLCRAKGLREALYTAVDSETVHIQDMHPTTAAYLHARKLRDYGLTVARLAPAGQGAPHQISATDLGRAAAALLRRRELTDSPA